MDNACDAVILNRLHESVEVVDVTNDHWSTLDIEDRCQDARLRIPVVQDHWLIDLLEPGGNMCPDRTDTDDHRGNSSLLRAGRESVSCIVCMSSEAGRRLRESFGHS